MEPSSPKLVADNPFEIPELYNVILQNTGSGDLAALMSTSRQMMTSADKLVSDYNRPLVGKILKSEENTQKGNKHIAYNDKVQYVDYLLWYWTRLDHRFLPLAVIWFEWAQAKSVLPITTFQYGWFKLPTLAMVATLATEFYKAIRRSPVTAAEMQTLSGLLSSSSQQLTTRDYEQIGLEGAVALWRFPPDYHVEFQLEASVILLHMKPEVVKMDVTIPEMSFGFDALVRSRLAYIGSLIYWMHRKPELLNIGIITSHFQLLETTGRKAKDDEENRTFKTICDHYAEGVIKMNKQATTAILSWRFDESAAQKLQDSPYGDLNLLHAMVPLQLRLDRLTWDFLEICAWRILEEQDNPKANFTTALVDVLSPPVQIIGRKAPMKKPLTDLDQLFLKEIVEKFESVVANLQIRVAYQGIRRNVADIVRRVIDTREKFILSQQTSSTDY